MTVDEALETLRSEIPGCTLVAFADLSSRLVLSSSSVSQPAREEVDALSDAVYQALDGALAEGAQPMWNDEAAKPGMAMLLTSSEARVVLRSTTAANEALICVCEPNADFRHVLNCGRQALDRIAAAS